MAGPSLAQKLWVPSASVDTSTLTTASFTPSAGDVLVIKLATWDVSATLALPSGGGQTYASSVTENPGANNGWCSIATCTITGSPGSMTVSSAHSGTASWHTMTVERWTSAQLAATPVTAVNHNGSGVPAATLTTSGANSVISTVNVDWNARSPSTAAYSNPTNVTPEDILDKSGSGDVVIYNWYQTVPTAGATSVGMTAPGLQNASMAAIEILASGAAPAANPAPVRTRLQAVGRAGIF